MGVQIDNIVVQAIWDEVGYLEALGKKRTAEVKRDAEIGAADAQREQVERVASADLAGSQARALADQRIVQAEKARDVARADYLAEVQAAVASAQAGPLAEATAIRVVRIAEVEVEKAETEARIGVEESASSRPKSQEADIVVPAMARREAVIAEAEGSARHSSLTATVKAPSAKRSLRPVRQS